MRMKATVPVAAMAFFVSVMASAQPAQVRASDTADQSYGYVFPDDPLSTGLFTANDVVLRVRSRTVRRTLIRPRAHFVPQLLKSVENI